MSEALRILPVNTNHRNDRDKNIPEPLLHPPFILLLQGLVKTGKSTLIQNLLCNVNMYASQKSHTFQKIVYVTPSLYDDATLQPFRELVEESGDDSIELTDQVKLIKQIYDGLRDYHHIFPDHQILLVLDDCLGFIKEDLANELSRSRHQHISLIITSQYFRKIPPLIRLNATGYILFRNNNDVEMKKIQDEVGCNYDNFLDMFDYATKEPYSFIYLPKETGNVYKCFTKKIYDYDSKQLFLS